MSSREAEAEMRAEIAEASGATLLDAAEVVNAASHHIAALNVRLRVVGRADLAVVSPIARRWPHSADATTLPRWRSPARADFQRDLTPPTERPLPRLASR
jgi:hypothetical protein